LIIIFWIPAHINIPGNEKTDEAAKKVSTDNNTPEIVLSSLKDAIRCAVEKSKRAHQQLWDQESNNKLHQIKPSLAPNLYPPLPAQDENRQYGHVSKSATQTIVTST